MTALKQTTIVVSIAVAAALCLAAPASAGPAVDACTMAGVPLCGFIPVVGDVDRVLDTGLPPGEMPDLNQLTELARLGTTLAGS